MGDDGEVPWDGESTGEVEVRGPWIATRLLRGPERRRQVPRRLAAHGRHRLDRLAGVHADHRPRQGPDQVGRRVDLLGRARERADGASRRAGGGGDRQAGRALDRAPARLRRAAGRAPIRTPEELREHLEPLVAKWWLPDEFAFIEAVPKTSVGKFDKKVLRAQLAEGAPGHGAGGDRPAREVGHSADTIPPLRRALPRPGHPDDSMHATQTRLPKSRDHAQDPRRRGQARPRRSRPRGEDHRPRAARRRHGGDLHGAPPDSRADRRDRDPGGRRRGRPVDPLRGPHDAGPARAWTC